MWERDDHPYRETARVTPLLVLWIVIVFALFLALLTGWLGYEKFYVNRETAITRQTNQYQSSTQQHLVSLVASYQDLDTKIAQLSTNPANAAIVQGMRDQQQTTLVEIHQQIATIQPDQIPPSVSSFLARHGG